MDANAAPRATEVGFRRLGKALVLDTGTPKPAIP